MFFKWFVSFSIHRRGTNMKLTFSENKSAVELENVYSEIKICVYVELSFCWKTNITDPQKKKRSPLLTLSLLDWWCPLVRAALETVIREQTGGVLFNKVPLKKKKRKFFSKFKELHLKCVKHSCASSVFEKERKWDCTLLSNLKDTRPHYDVWCYVLRDAHKEGYDFFVFYWILQA